MDLFISLQGSLSLNSCYAWLRHHKTYPTITCKSKTFRDLIAEYSQAGFKQVLTI